MAKRDISDKDEDYDRAHRLVGRFFQHWSLTERAIDRSISAILDLKSPANVIILANVQLRSKIHILRTAFGSIPVASPERNQANKTLNRIARMADRRNLLAHNIFYPMNDGSVEVSRVEAKGKLAFPSVFWNERTFDRFCHTMGGIRQALETHTNAVAHRQAVINALMATPTPRPIEELASQVGLSPPFPLTQFQHSSPAPQANQETIPQIGQSPQPKGEAE